MKAFHFFREWKRGKRKEHLLLHLSFSDTKKYWSWPKHFILYILNTFLLLRFCKHLDQIPFLLTSVFKYDWIADAEVSPTSPPPTDSSFMTLSLFLVLILAFIWSFSEVIQLITLAEYQPINKIVIFQLDKWDDSTPNGARTSPKKMMRPCTREQDSPSWQQ